VGITFINVNKETPGIDLKNTSQKPGRVYRGDIKTEGVEEGKEGGRNGSHWKRLLDWWKKRKSRICRCMLEIPNPN